MSLAVNVKTSNYFVEEKYPWCKILILGSHASSVRLNGLGRNSVANILFFLVDNGEVELHHDPPWFLRNRRLTRGNFRFL
ncbi:hypothetical protein J6590_050609 [Homalodisca vitripennis]|nr:hypothetical protein J6590_050609 [Homalodisca vitripennis]